MVAGCGAGALAGPAATLLAREGAAPAYFGLHPFIEAHPEAVFIRMTGVASKNDSEAKKSAGLAFANQIFSLRDKPGIPLSHKLAIKPNLTSAGGMGTANAIVTDSFVVEGFIEGVKKTVGLPSGQIYLREGLMTSQPGVGYVELAQRTGTHYGDDDSRTPVTKECPDGVVFRRTKYLGPFNYPDSYLVNFAKFKSHAMGLTICVKNLQGTNIRPYIRFCGGVQEAIADDFQPDAQDHVSALYRKHLQAGMPRWETEKGEWMEMWIQRTIDHYTLIKPNIGLNIIEGVYGQNGNGFNHGPGPEAMPEIFMTNMLIFGKDAFNVDIIGHWLGGHEPGNFGLFHLGKERGVSTALNPANIPVYLWEDGGPKLTPISNFKRTPLATLYLAKSGEDQYHMVNEAFTYPAEPRSAGLSGGEKPGFKILGVNRPGNGPSSLVVEYNLPADGQAMLELYNSIGDRVGVLARGPQARGAHAAEWRTHRAAPGDYVCRMRTNGFDQSRRITLAG
jgi:uncharacterized protein (DUF362 family)